MAELDLQTDPSGSKDYIFSTVDVVYSSESFKILDEFRRKVQTVQKNLTK